MSWFKNKFRISKDPLTSEERSEIIEKSSKQVGPGVFFSTIVTIASFLPVFLLTGMEGKLFSPLAWTKTFILLVDAFLAITLTPILIVLLLRGKLKPESANPINRFLEKIYTPILKWCLRYRKTTIGINLLALAVSVPMMLNLGTEFMPPLDEGSLLFMPVTLPDVSNSEVKRLLQVQDKLIKTVPEVSHVMGKAGRANTATDNSPISMLETIVLLKPKSEWREGKTKDDIINELNAKLQILGVTNGWTQPIINRINMLSTGIRTDVGLKVYGQSLDSINRVSQMLKKQLEGIDGVKDLYVEPITGGKYIDIIVKKEEIGRYGLSVDDVSLLNNGKKTHPAESSWTEENSQTVLRFNTGQTGTGMAALSTKPKSIKLSAKDFTEYLIHDGIKDVYEARKKSGEEAKGATEKYSKHVKALFQVGDKLTDDYKAALGYPVEFVPLSNPYSAKAGDELSFRLLKKGKPLANELVYGSYVGHHSHGADGSHREALSVRSDKNGIVKLKATKGQWYLRTIHMTKTTEKGFDYESNWATITFEIK